MGKHGKRWIISVLLAGMVMMMWIMPARAEDTPSGLKTVRVSCGMNDAIYLDADGKAQVICADYLAMLSYVNHWKLEYVEGSWNESVQNLYDGKIDLLLPAQKTEDRLDRMAFSEYIGGYQPIVLIAQNDEEIYYEDYASMDHKRVAVSSGTSNEQQLLTYAEKNHITFEVKEINTFDEKLTALQNGEVDLIAISAFNSFPNGKTVATLEYLPFYYCTSIDNTELMDELNAGMKEIMSVKPNMVTDVFSTVINGTTPKAYSREEAAAIQNTDHITIGVYADSLPLAGKNADGEDVGIYIDLLKELESKAGISVIVKEIPRSQFLYDSLDDGSVDFVMGTRRLPYLAKDTSNYMVTESLMSYVTDAVTMPDYSFDNTKPATIVLTNARKYLESDILAITPNATFIYVDNAKECLKALQSGKADITFMNSWEYNYHSKNPRFQNMIEWSSIYFETSIVLGALRTTDSQLLSVVDKAVTAIAMKEHNQIVTANLNMAYASLDLEDKWYSVRNTVIIFAGILLLILISAFVYLHMRRMYIKQLQENNKQLREANEAKTAFLSRMSHELRTPLNAINGYADLEEETIENEIYDKGVLLQSVHTTKRAANYLLAIINDLLDIQSIEHGKIVIHKIEVNVTDYMQDVVQMIQKEADEKKIDFTYERLTGLGENYLFDGVRLQQILLNILHNAIKFTPEGGTVTITSRDIEQADSHVYIEFAISDTGIGMSEEFLREKLFQKFTQENADITSPYDGCGTGMAITKQLVELMGGEISCTSEKGVGTTFTFRIPTQLVRKGRRRQRREQPDYDLSGIHVLLCEDNLMNQEMERRLLEKMKCEVTVAEDGKAGLEKFSQSQMNYFSIILMDIRMPNMDGLEATTAIRSLSREDAKRIPILAVSANAFEEDVKASLEAGMNEHLSKPVDANIIYEKIREYCQC